MRFLNKQFWMIFFIALMFLRTDGQTQNLCVGYGPQSPRDIRQHKGTNKMSSSLAPKYENMNLCSIHFHKNAEHRGKNFDINTNGKGFKCTFSPYVKEEKRSTKNQKRV
ncbi:MAG: hypothetical protein ETSY1_45435 [Candidatus Entotheonella factor]|uniref:Uncharacterized protein n=1 Tax=Entotheonella factor TaxID=1429438 RepID=W4L2B0_ENTF1|nr:MAG: hypothetical protein ETSY1_45435 [Candidatus Entotheonella factor]